MLRERVITALVLASILLWVVLFAPTKLVIGIITVVILLGAWEWSRFCGLTSRLPRVIYALVITLMTLAASWLFMGVADGAMVDHHAVMRPLLLAAGWWLCALAWLLLMPLRTNAASTAVAGALVLVPTWIALVYLHQTAQFGRQLLLFLLILVVTADVAAYFAGRTFGRVKLAPRVSPGKTWEGVFGAIAGAVLVSLAGAYWFHLPIGAFVAVCLAVVIASIVGDLTESMFKRHVGLKDSGTILPGHGGILDRMDSITAAAPLFALGMIWIGALP